MHREFAVISEQHGLAVIAAHPGVAVRCIRPTKGLRLLGSPRWRTNPAPTGIADIVDTLGLPVDRAVEVPLPRFEVSHPIRAEIGLGQFVRDGPRFGINFLQLKPCFPRGGALGGGLIT